MNAPQKINSRFRVSKITTTRIILALAIAVIADVIQFSIGPFGWVFSDQAIDLVAMLLISSLIGFHWLLLPTFVVELIPVVDELPTWTACVVGVIAIRRREQRALAASKPAIEI